MKSILPKKVRIMGRLSSVTNSFFNGIIPWIEPTEDEIMRHLEVLDMSESAKCVYCGKENHTWDHLNPLIRDRFATGYITEINNLVPACGKCNSSKGNKNWREFIEYLKENGRIDEQQFLIAEKVIEKYEAEFNPIKLNIKDSPRMSEYLQFLYQIEETMKGATEIEKFIEDELRKQYKKTKTI